MVAALRNWHKTLTGTDQRSAGRRPLLYSVSSLAHVAAGSRAAVTYCLSLFSSSDICTQCVLHPRTIHKTTPLLLPPLPPYSKITDTRVYFISWDFFSFSPSMPSLVQIAWIIRRLSKSLFHEHETWDQLSRGTPTFPHIHPCLCYGSSTLPCRTRWHVIMYNSDDSNTTVLSGSSMTILKADVQCLRKGP